MSIDEKWLVCQGERAKVNCPVVHNTLGPFIMSHLGVMREKPSSRVGGIEQDF